MTYDSTNKLWKFEFTSNNTYVNFTVRSYYSDKYHEYYANQGVSSANTWSSAQNNPQDSGTSFYLSGLTTNKQYRIELKGADSSENHFIFRYVPTETPPKMNLPLKPADFDNGTKHYFLVGTRIGDWRLQPEWELTKQADGTFAINTPRVMYQGRIGVAEVTSYDNYKNGIYDLYFQGNYWIKKSANNPILSHKGTINYYEYDLKNITGDLFLADKERFSRDSIMTSKGVVIGSINYNPTSHQLLFNYSDEPVSKYITFSLVGSNIMNANLPDNDKTQRSTKFGKSAMNNWQDAWVQYDENGVPYRDAKGTLFYQTVFQNDWLEKHPTKFNLNLAGGRQFDYASRNVVMVNTEAMSAKELAEDPYAPLYKRFEKQGNNNLGKVEGNDQVVTIKDDDNNTVYTYKEWMDMYGNNPQGIGRSANWECYVVKDMWIDGSFKVWTGWGGGIKETENSGAEGSDNDSARWYYVNGGHGVENKDYLIKGYDITSTKADEVIAIYGTKRDVNAANFKVSDAGNPIYFKRVIVWYDPSEQDFQNSAIQLIIEKCGPNIKAFRNSSDGSAVDYSWNVPQDGLTDKEKNQEVTHATITLQRWDGSKWVNVKVVYNGDPDPAPATIGDCTGTDGSKNDLPGGTYRYTIDLTYNDGKEDITRSAVSNEITLYDASAPVVAKASQRTEEINGDTYYSFDLVLDLKLTDATLEAKYGDNEELDIFDLAEAYYVNCTDDALVTRINAGTSDSSLKFTAGIKSVYNPTINDIDKIDGNWIEVPFTSKSNVAKRLQWSNVAVGSGKDYPFTVYLKYKETNKDKFKLVRFEPTKTSMQFVIPRMELKAVESAVEKVTAPANFKTPEEAMPLGSHNLGEQAQPAQPVHYTAFNNLYAKFEIVAPKVTPSVVAAYGLEYNVNVGSDGPRTIKASDTNSVSVVRNFLSPSVEVINKDVTSGMKNIFYSLTDATTEYTAFGSVTYAKKDKSVSFGTEDVRASLNLAKPELEKPVVHFGKVNLSTYENSVKEGTERYIVHDAYAELVYGAGQHNDLARAIGYHVYGKYPNVELSGAKDTKAHNGGKVVTQAEASANDLLESGLAGYAAYDGTYNNSNDWSTLGLTGTVPVYVDHISAHDMKTSAHDTYGGDNTVYAIVTFHYPFLVETTPGTTGYSVVNLTTYDNTLHKTADNVATGIGEVNADEIEGAVFYNLQGIRVANPERGQIYIMTTAAGARKIRF